MSARGTMRAVLEDIQVRVWRSHVKIPMIFLAPAMLLVTLYVIVYLAANTAWATRALNAQLPALLQGEGWVEDLSVSPTLSSVKVWDARLRDRRGAHVFTVDRVDAAIDPLLLLRGTLELERGVLTGVDLRLSFERGEEYNRINLLDALGLYEPTEQDEPEGEGGGMDIHLLGLRFEDSTFSMVYPEIFELDAPVVNIPNGEVHIADGNLQMWVPEMPVPRMNLRFYAELFGYDPEESEDWEFSATGLNLKGWRWSNMGFLIEGFEADVEGYDLWMGGAMAFPEEEGMTYDASARVSAPYRSTLIEYWVGDYIYYEMEDFVIAGRGNLDFVEAGVEINASLVDVYGMQFQDVHAVGGVDSAMFYADDVTGYLAGGEIDLDWAFFHVFEKQYGMAGSFEGIDPAEVLAQMDVEMPSLAGRARGAISMLGEVPPSRPDPLIPEQFWGQATENWATVEVTEDLVLERTSRELIPGNRVKVLAGSSGFVTRDLAGVTRAELAIGPDRFVATDSALDYRSYEWVPWRQGVGATVRGRIADIAPYAEFYGGVGAASGPARLDVDLWGPLIHPEIDMSMEAVEVQVDGAKVPIDEFAMKARVRGGRLWLDEVEARTGKSVAQVRGWLDALYVWRSDPPEESLPRYRVRGRIPASLEVDADGFDLGAITPLLPKSLGLRGKLTRARFDLAGTLSRPVVCASVEASGLLAYGERARRAVFEGGWRAKGARGKCSRLDVDLPEEGGRLDRVLVDMGEAGVFAGRGRVGADGALEGEFDGKGLELGALASVKELGLGVRASGDVSLKVDGTLERPEISGHVTLERVGASGVSLGDFVLVVDTLEERYEEPGEEPVIEQTIYMSGALMPPVSKGRESSASLPWLKLEVEVPLDDVSPVYARVGLDSVDVIDLGRGVEIGEIAPGLSPLAALERLVLTGTVELYAYRDRPGYSVVATLPGFELGPRELGLSNELPISVGFVSEEQGGEMRQLVTVEHFSVGAGEQFVTLGGSYSPNDGFLDLTMDGAVRLSLVPSLRRAFPGLVPDEILDARGLLAVNASVRGEASSPLVTGSVSPRDATFVLRSLNEPLTLKSGRLDLSSRGVRVPQNQPVRGEALGGQFEVSGGVAFSQGEQGLSLGALDMKGWSHNMSYSVAQTANLTFDTDLRVQAGSALELSTWLVSGEVSLLDGLFYRNISLLEDELTGRVLGAFDRRAELFESSVFERNPELEEVNFDVGITARDSFKIKNQIDRFLLDMELRMALRLSQTLGNPRLLGDIEVVDGDVVFQGEQFEVRDGLVRFDGPLDDPFVDVAAAADIRNACDAIADDDEAEPLVGVTSAIEEQDSTTYHITLTVRGRTEQLELLYDSTPYADQRDVISLLLTGCTVDLLTASSASQPTLEIALGPLIGRLEREVQDVVEVEEFTIVPGVERTELRISDNLTRRLSWDFQLDTGFNDNVGSGQTAQLEYKLADGLAAEVSESSRSASASSAGSFTIDIKLKYRFFLD